MNTVLLLIAGSCSATVALLGMPALANPSACNQAYVETQRLQRGGQLLRAREQALACARDECSVTVRRDCSTWLEDISDAMPSVVVEARDTAGDAVLDVRVFSGDRLLAERLDGKALPLDPGVHELRFERGDQIETLQVIALEGQAYRHVAVRFGSTQDEEATTAAPELGAAKPAAAAPRVSFVSSASAPLQPASLSLPIEPAGASSVAARTPVRHSTATPHAAAAAAPRDVTAPEQGRTLPLSAHVFGGVGLASLTAFGLLATSAYADERDLSRSCGRACDARAIDSVHDRYLMADVALAFGLSSLVAAGALWLFLPSDAPPPELRGSRLTYEGRF